MQRLRGYVAGREVMFHAHLGVSAPAFHAFCEDQFVLVQEADVIP